MIARSDRLPDLFPSLGPAVRAVLFHDFDGAPASAPVTEIDIAREFATIVAQRLPSVALRYAAAHAINIGPELTMELRNAEFQWMWVSRATVAASAGGLAALAAAGVEVAVTKGPGLAAQCGRLADRPFTDIDVVVRRADFEPAISCLEAIGYAEEERNVQPWPVFNRWCREAVNLRHPDGGSLDVHHRLPPWYWSTGLTAERLLAEASPCSVLGATLPVVSARHNLLVSALHVFSDRNRPGATLMAWRDILTAAAACDPTAVAAEATATGLGSWLSWILQCVPASCRPGGLQAALATEEPALRGRSRLRLLGPDRIGSRHLLGQALRLPTPHAALFLAGMAIPSPRFLEHALPGSAKPYRTWWRRSMQHLSAAARS